MADNSK